MSLGDLFKKALSASTQGNTSGFGHAMTGFSASHLGDIANFFGSPNSSGNSNHSPGTPAFLSADGLVSPIQSASGGGSKSSTGVTTSVVAPTPTLVGSNANGLQIKLIWDTSVGAMGSLMSTFQNAVITAAKFYTNTYSTHETINIQVGFGEVAGQKLPSGALAASESYGYLEKYASVAAALKQDANWSTAQRSADATLPSSDPTKGGRAASAQPRSGDRA